MENEKENINRLNFRELNFVFKLVRLKVPEQINFNDYFPILHILDIFIDLGKKRVKQSKSILKKAKSTRRELGKYFYFGIMPKLREKLYQNIDSFHEIMPFIKELVKIPFSYNFFYRRLLYNDRRILDIRRPRGQILKLKNGTRRKQEIEELLIQNFKNYFPSQQISGLKFFLYQIEEDFVYVLGKNEKDAIDTLIFDYNLETRETSPSLYEGIPLEVQKVLKHIELRYYITERYKIRNPTEHGFPFEDRLHEIIKTFSIERKIQHFFQELNTCGKGVKTNKLIKNLPSEFQENPTIQKQLPHFKQLYDITQQEVDQSISQLSKNFYNCIKNQIIYILKSLLVEENYYYLKSQGLNDPLTDYFNSKFPKIEQLFRKAIIEIEGLSQSLFSQDGNATKLLLTREKLWYSAFRQLIQAALLTGQFSEKIVALEEYNKKFPNEMQILKAKGLRDLKELNEKINFFK